MRRMGGEREGEGKGMKMVEWAAARHAVQGGGGGGRPHYHYNPAWAPLGGLTTWP
jgi:hypothetical protein